MKKIILLTSFVVLFIVGCTDFDRSPEHQINIINIEETPIKNAKGYIEDIKFTLFLDPNTLVPDGKYSWAGCVLESFLPHEVHWPRDNSYHNLTQISTCKQQDIIVKDNTFDLVLGESIFDNIIKYELDGPYLLLIWNNFYDYSQTDIYSVTYTLNLKDKALYNELCEVDKADLNVHGEAWDRCGLKPKNREYQIILLPYKTGSYNYTDFIGN